MVAIIFPDVELISSQWVNLSVNHGGAARPNRKERIETITVVFVPPTSGRKLAEMLKEKEDNLANITKFRIRYQEAGGTKLGISLSGSSSLYS